jgi:hypothetical protein
MRRVGPARPLPVIHTPINCADRTHLCHAACCKLWEIPEIGKPKDTKCENLTCGLRCGIYEDRPPTCRQYDCRNDKRIWLDFENYVINPELEERLKAQGLTND